MHEPFAEFALLLIITAAVSALAVRLRQPVLIAYIAVGILVGPAGLSLVTAHDQNEAARLARLDQVEVLHPFNQAADFAALNLAARIASAERSPAKESP